jgi:hypothetical protein
MGGILGGNFGSADVFSMFFSENLNRFSAKISIVFQQKSDRFSAKRLSLDMHSDLT